MNSLTKILIAVTVLSLLIALYFFADARSSPIFPGCIFYSLTGLYCPGCGSQRAFSSLLHGQLWQALNYNLLFMASLPLLFYVAIITVVNVFKKGPPVHHLLHSTSFMKILLAIVIIFSIARNLPFYPFNLLAPHVIY